MHYTVSIPQTCAELCWRASMQGVARRLRKTAFSEESCSEAFVINEPEQLVSYCAAMSQKPSIIVIAHSAGK